MITSVVDFVPQLPILLFVVVLVLVLFLTDVPKHVIEYYLAQYQLGQDVAPPHPSCRNDTNDRTSNKQPKLPVESGIPDPSRPLTTNLHIQPAKNYSPPASTQDEADILTSDKKPKLPEVLDEPDFLDTNPPVHSPKNHTPLPFSQDDVSTSDETLKFPLEGGVSNQSHLLAVNLHLLPTKHANPPPYTQDIHTSDEKPKLPVEAGFPDQSHLIVDNVQLEPAKNHSPPPYSQDDVRTLDEKWKLSLEAEVDDESHICTVDLNVEPVIKHSPPISSNDEAEVRSSDENPPLPLEAVVPDQFNLVGTNLHLETAKNYSPLNIDKHFGDCQSLEQTSGDKDGSRHADIHGTEIDYSSDLFAIAGDEAGLINSEDDSSVICRENVEECMLKASFSKETFNRVDEVGLLNNDDVSRLISHENVEDCVLKATFPNETSNEVNEVLNNDDSRLICQESVDECFLKATFPKETSNEVDEVLNNGDPRLVCRESVGECFLKATFPKETSNEGNEVLNNSDDSRLICRESVDECFLNATFPKETSNEVDEVLNNGDPQLICQERVDECFLNATFPKETSNEVNEVLNNGGDPRLICRESVDECFLNATFPKETSNEVDEILNNGDDSRLICRESIDESVLRAIIFEETINKVDEVVLINSVDDPLLICREIIDECVFKATLSSEVEDIGLINSKDDSFLICQEILDECILRATFPKETFDVVNLEASNDSITTQSDVSLIEQSHTTTPEELSSASNDDAERRCEEETNYALPDINDISKQLNNLVSNICWCAASYFSKEVSPPAETHSCPTETSSLPQQLRCKDAHVCDDSMHCASAERWSDEDANSDEYNMQAAQNDAQLTTECDSNEMESRKEDTDIQEGVECIESDTNLMKSLEAIENVTEIESCRWSNEDANSDEYNMQAAQKEAQLTTECDSNEMESRNGVIEELECIESDTNFMKSLEVIENVTEIANERERVAAADELNGFEKALKDIENATDKVDELARELDDLEKSMATTCHADVTERVTNLENALADLLMSKLTTYFDTLEQTKSLKDITDECIDNTLENSSYAEDRKVCDMNDAEEINTIITRCDGGAAVEESVILESLQDGSVLSLENRHQSFVDEKDNVLSEAIENDAVLYGSEGLSECNDSIDKKAEIHIEETSETKEAALENSPNNYLPPQVGFDSTTNDEAKTSDIIPTPLGNNCGAPIETSACVDGTSVRIQITPPGGVQDTNGFVVKHIDVEIRTMQSTNNFAGEDLAPEEENKLNNSSKQKRKENKRNSVQDSATQQQNVSHITESWVCIENTAPIMNQESIGSISPATSTISDDLSSTPDVTDDVGHQEAVSDNNIGSNIDLNDVYMSMMMENILSEVSAQDNGRERFLEGDTNRTTEENALRTADEFSSSEAKVSSKELSDECSYIDEIDLRKEESEKSTVENQLSSSVKELSDECCAKMSASYIDDIDLRKEESETMSVKSNVSSSVKELSDVCCAKKPDSCIDDVDLRNKESDPSSIENKLSSSVKAESSFEASSSPATGRGELFKATDSEEKQRTSVSIEDKVNNVSETSEKSGPSTNAVLDARTSIRKRLEKFELMSTRLKVADQTHSSTEIAKTKSLDHETMPQKYYQFGWKRSGVAEVPANQKPINILKGENKDLVDMNRRQHWFSKETDSEKLQTVVKSKSEDLRYSHKTGRNRWDYAVDETATGQETATVGPILTQCGSSRRKAVNEITKYWERKRSSDARCHLSSHSSCLSENNQDSVRVFCLECFDTAEKLNAVEEELFLTEYQRVDATGSSGSGLDRHRDSVELLTAKSFDSTERRRLRGDTDSGLLRHKDSFELISSKSAESSDRRNTSEQELGMYHDEDDEVDNVAAMASTSSGLVKHKDSVDMLCVKSFHSADRRISFGDELNVMVGEFLVDDDEVGGAGLERHRDSVEVMAVKSRNSTEEDESHGTHSPKSILKINKTRSNSRSVSWKDLKEKISNQSSTGGEANSNTALSRSRLILEQSKEHHRSILDASIFSPPTVSDLKADEAGENNASRVGSLIRIFNGKKAFKYPPSECSEEYSSFEEGSWSDVKIKTATTQTGNDTKSIETNVEVNARREVEDSAKKESYPETVNVDEATMTDTEELDKCVKEGVENINNTTTDTVEESSSGGEAQPGPYLGVKAKSLDHTDSPNDNLTTRLIKLSEKFKCKTAQSDNALKVESMPQSGEYHFVKDRVSILERYYDRISSIKLQDSQQEDSGNEEKTG